MPRKNQRRKNANNGRRKPKPIKFNPSEIVSEQKLLNVNQDDAIDEEQEMESCDETTQIQTVDENIMCRLSPNAADDNDNDQTHQMVTNDVLKGSAGKISSFLSIELISP